MQPQYAYILTTDSFMPPTVFTWPNCARKYIRDTYTVDGVLRLPPKGHMSLHKHKVNPKAGRAPVQELIDIERFLDQA